ncbi:MAG: 16S rRNA (guanine(527)-N(7))-methyltransferase RsmG [Alphaproteobacteria bacterium]|nr:16S rRNA (guanine(527)-N(7))-methyltransferase RsmG [Alphaproteobacteria bacterium]
MTHPLTALIRSRLPSIASMVTPEILSALDAYVAHLLKWNPKINLIGPSTEQDVWERHILDSLQLAVLIPLHHRILDIGSGAGLPGVPLAMLGYDVTMVESDTRKSVFIQEAIRIGGIGTRARVLAVRIEALPKGQYDTICARALAPLTELCAHAYPQMGTNAQCLFPKGERYRIEKAYAECAWSYHSHEHTSVSNAKSVILQLTDLRPTAS